MLNSYELNPYIRAIERRTLSAKEVVRYTSPIDHALAFIDDAEVILSINGTELAAHTADFLLFLPNVPYTVTAGSGGATLRTVHFDPRYDLHSERLAELITDDKDRVAREDLLIRDSKTPILKIRDKAEAARLFNRLFETPRTDGYLKKKCILTEILAFLAEDNFKELLAIPDSHPIEAQIKSYIDSGRCMAIGLDDLSAMFSYDKFYLEKRFRERFGTGIMAYRNKKRMETAKELLKSDTVSGVAEKTGFKSIYSFSRAFKQFWGTAPSKEKA